MTRYDKVTVRSYKDEDMAGTEAMAREHGKWFVHGIKDGTADLITTEEEKVRAVEIAEDKAQPEEDGTTQLVVKNLESEIERNETHSSTTIQPEEME